MKFSTTANDLFRSLKTVSGVITSTMMPIIECFKFNLDGTKLTVTGTDLETSVITIIDVNSKDKGEWCVPAKILMETLRTFGDDELTFKFGASLEIISSSGRFKIPTLDAKDFPVIQSDLQDGFTIVADTLKDAIDRTIFATGTDELRPILSGVLFDKGVMVATDSHRLVKYPSSYTGGQVVINKKPLNLIRSIIYGQSDVTVYVNEERIIFNFGDTFIICRAVDGKYPNYEAVIPTDNHKRLKVRREMLLNSLRRVSIYSNRTTHTVTLTINGGNMTVKAADVDFNKEAEEEISCEFNADQMTIGFNSQLLTECLTNVEAETVYIDLSEANKPGLIRSEKSDMLMLVMPVMIQ